jgi:hypothetical protein
MEEATNAITEMNGKSVDGKDLIVVLKKAKGEGKGRGKSEGKGEGKGKGKGKGKDEKGKGKGKGKKGKYDAQAQAAAPYAQAYNPYAAYYMQQQQYAYAGMYNPYAAAYAAQSQMYQQMAASPAAQAQYQQAVQAQYAAAMQMMSPTARPADGNAFGMPAAPVSPTAAAPAAMSKEEGGKGKGKGKKGGEKGGGKGKGKSKSKEKKEDVPSVPKDPPPEGKEFVGTLRSMSEKNGYGFITSDEAKEIGQKSNWWYESDLKNKDKNNPPKHDVYVDLDQLPKNAKEKDQLKFSIALSSKGQPQAQNVTLA